MNIAPQLLESEENPFLRDCLCEPTDDQNRVSLHHRGACLGRPPFQALEESSAAVAGNPAFRFYEKYGFQLNAQILWWTDMH